MLIAEESSEKCNNSTLLCITKPSERRYILSMHFKAKSYTEMEWFDQTVFDKMTCKKITKPLWEKSQKRSGTNPASRCHRNPKSGAHTNPPGFSRKAWGGAAAVGSVALLNIPISVTTKSFGNRSPQGTTWKNVSKLENESEEKHRFKLEHARSTRLAINCCNVGVGENCWDFR